MESMRRVVVASVLFVAGTFGTACTVNGGEQEVGANSEAMTRVAAEGVAAMVPIAAPLAAGGQQAGDLAEGAGGAEDAGGGGGDGGGGADSRETQQAIQGGFDGQSCVSFAWTGAAAELTFEECIMPQTGTYVDGGLSLGVALFPTRLTVGFEELTVDDLSLDGSFTLELPQEGTPGVGLDADLTWARAGETANLTLTDARVVHASGSTTLDGSGSVSSGLMSASVAMSALQWQGRCLPQSGSVTAQSPNLPPATLTFLSTTPDDGIVSMQVGNLPASNQALFHPCPSE
jgi:hypothetical protein